MTLGNKIKMFRGFLGLSQSELGMLVGSNQRMVAMWEMGKFKPPLHILEYLSAIFSLCEDWFLNDISPVFDCTVVHVRFELLKEDKSLFVRKRNELIDIFATLFKDFLISIKVKEVFYFSVTSFLINSIYLKLIILCYVLKLIKQCK